MCVCVCVCVCACVCALAHVCVCVCVCAREHSYVCACVCVRAHARMRVHVKKGWGRRGEGRERETRFTVLNSVSCSTDIFLSHSVK